MNLSEYHSKFGSLHGDTKKNAEMANAKKETSPRTEEKPKNTKKLQVDHSDSFSQLCFETLGPFQVKLQRLERSESKDQTDAKFSKW